MEASYASMVLLMNGSKFVCTEITRNMYTFISEAIVDGADYQTVTLHVDCLNLKRNLNKHDRCHLQLSSDRGLIDVF